MNKKVEKAIEILMADSGYVWYEDEWVDRDTAAFREEDKSN